MSVTPFSWKLEYPKELTEQFGEIVLSKSTSFRYSARVVIFISVKTVQSKTFLTEKKLARKTKKINKILREKPKKSIKIPAWKYKKKFFSS